MKELKPQLGHDSPLAHIANQEQKLLYSTQGLLQRLMEVLSSVYMCLGKPVLCLRERQWRTACILMELCR